MKLLLRSQLVFCRSILHAVIRAERVPNRNVGAVRHQPETFLLLPPYNMSCHSGVSFRPGPVALFLCQQIASSTVSLLAPTLPAELCPLLLFMWELPKYVTESCPKDL